MEIKINFLKQGFHTSLLKNSKILYPKDVWGSIKKENREAIAENLAYLKISPYSMFFEQEFYFNFSKPYLKDLGDRGMIKDMPRIAAEDKTSTKKLMQMFRNKKTRFRDVNMKLIEGIGTNDSALIGMSFGKDSLLSYGIAKELDLAPKLVMVQDFWDIESAHKLDLIKRFKKEFNAQTAIIVDELNSICDVRRMNKKKSEGIVNANAMNAYIAMFLPLAEHNKAKYLVFGNEQNLNDCFIDKEGFKVYPSYDQSSEWMQEQNKSLKEFTNNSIQVTSLVEPIYNIAEVKVLFNRYPKIAKYQMSCALLKIKKKKEMWCYNCAMCARAFLYLTSIGINPKAISFNKNFLEKKYKNLYPLFNKNISTLYEKPLAARDEQLFAFYLAFRKGKKGYLMDIFKKEYLTEAKKREDELYNRFFGIYNSYSMPPSIKKKVGSIYKEELSNKD